MSIFTGFKFRTPAGHLSEREQDALIKFVLARLAIRPATAHEVQMVLEGTLDARDLSEGTLAVLRQISTDFVVAGKPLEDRGTVFAHRIQLVPMHR